MAKWVLGEVNKSVRRPVYTWIGLRLDTTVRMHLNSAPIAFFFIPPFLSLSHLLSILRVYPSTQ